MGAHVGPAAFFRRLARTIQLAVRLGAHKDSMQPMTDVLVGSAETNVVIAVEPVGDVIEDFNGYDPEV